MNLTEMRTRVRRDLHDEDAQNYRWSDDEIDRHIERAVGELSLSLPLEAKETLNTTAGSRELSLATLSDRVVVEAVEYPVGNYPPLYVRFSIWADALTMLIERVPGDGEDVYVYYGKLHTLDANGSTIPQALEDVVALGAAGYAALQWSSFATNRVNVGGDQTWRHYLTWGQDRLAAFMRELARHGRKNMVRVRQLYRPYEPPADQSTVFLP